MKTIRPWTAYVMIVGGFVAGVGTVVSLTNGFHPSAAIARPGTVDGKLVGNITPEESATLHTLNSSLTNLAQFVKPAVVHIRAVSSRKSDSDGKMVPISGSEGAGFIYRKDGYVITNDHVVAEANEVTVIMNDGREYKGTVKRAPEWDVAVIKIEGNEFPTLGLADSKSVLPGQMVMAIGSPYGLENSVTFGHVSATKRENAVSDGGTTGQGERFYPDLIQTDAAINVGNSGGPLVNIDGQVVGMNSSIYTKTGGSNGIAFAIPSNQVRFIADILIQKGKVVRSQLGVYPRDLKPFELAERKLTGGAYVNDVTPGGPADKAGIKKGDIITKINAKPIDGQIDLRNAMLENAPNTTIDIEFLHDGKSMKAQTKLEEGKELKVSPSKPKMYPFNPKDFGDLFADPNQDDLRERLRLREKADENEKDVAPLNDGKARLGVEITELTSDIRKKNNIPDAARGVVIGRVEPGSVAEKYGFEAGDVIQSIGGKKVESVGQLTAEIGRMNRGDKTHIQVSRYSKGSQMTIEKDITFK